MIRGFVSTVMALLVVGCSSGSQRTAARKHIVQVANYLSQYAATNDSKAPPNEEAFKKYLSEVRKTSDHAEILTSPEDKQAYSIVYGISYKLKLGKEGLVPPDQLPRIKIAQEKTGKDGKIWVAYVGGIVEQIDASAAK